MKKALFVMTTVALASSAFADATIKFASRSIDKADGSGQYDVPIWANGGSGTQGAGTLTGGVTVGLFFNGTQIVSSALRTGTSPQFLATSSQTATIPGVQPGTTQTLVIREWQGSSFANAQATQGQQWGEQTFTSKPLGGTDNGGNIFLPPTLTGWGPESGAGITLNITPTPEPTTIAFGALGIGALLLRRRK
jgi:hypothetical protein